jgi:hypothetical protein
MRQADWDGTDWEAGDCPPQLREALDSIRDLGRGPVPEPSDAVAAFFVDHPVRRAPRRRRQRNFLAGVLVAASMGLGAGAVAAASGAFHVSVEAGADGTADFSRPGINSAVIVPGTAVPTPATATPATRTPETTVPETSETTVPGAPATTAAQAPAQAPAVEQQPAGQRRYQAAPERTEAAAKRAAAVPGPKQARTPAPTATKRTAEVARRGQAVREDIVGRLDEAGPGLTDEVRETLAQLRGELRGL